MFVLHVVLFLFVFSDPRTVGARAEFRTDKQNRHLFIAEEKLVINSVTEPNFELAAKTGGRVGTYRTLLTAHVRPMFIHSVCCDAEGLPQTYQNIVDGVAQSAAAMADEHARHAQYTDVDDDDASISESSEYRRYNSQVEEEEPDEDNGDEGKDDDDEGLCTRWELGSGSDVDAGDLADEYEDSLNDDNIDTEDWSDLIDNTVEESDHGSDEDSDINVESNDDNAQPRRSARKHASSSSSSSPSQRTSRTTTIAKRKHEQAVRREQHVLDRHAGDVDSKSVAVVEGMIRNMHCRQWLFVEFSAILSEMVLREAGVPERCIPYCVGKPTRHAQRDVVVSS
jgi:hypothetical protein